MRYRKSYRKSSYRGRRRTGRRMSSYSASRGGVRL
jgi:hypothetical protein